jgi:hypothetical protein
VVSYVTPYTRSKLTPAEREILAQVPSTSVAVLSQRQMACLAHAGEISFLAVSSIFAIGWPMARLALWAVVCWFGKLCGFGWGVASPKFPCWANGSHEVRPMGTRRWVRTPRCR